MAHQKCRSALPVLYNSVACDICQKRICKDKDFQQRHLLKGKK